MDKKLVISFFGDYSPEQREEILENLRTLTAVEVSERETSKASSQNKKQRKKEESQLFSAPILKVGDDIKVRIFRDVDRMTGEFNPHYEIMIVKVKLIEPLQYIVYHAGLGEVFKIRRDQIVQYLPKAIV